MRAGGAAAAEIETLPEIEFDMSFLTVPDIAFDLSFLQVELAPIDAGELQALRLRERHESDLHAWFKERASELADRAALRDGARDQEISDILVRLGAHHAG
jgi:hypothetical protein